MKYVLIIFIGLVYAFTFVNANASKELNSQTIAANDKQKIILKVSGLVCAFCAQGVEKKFKEVAATDAIHVDLDKMEVELTTKSGMDIGDEQLKKIITEAGFNVLAINRLKESK